MSVSVVIPCYNQGRFLGEAIASTEAHQGLVSKIVVVDDGSTDETPAVAKRDGSVKYLRQERKGLSEARNSGWRASSGDYVVFAAALARAARPYRHPRAYRVLAPAAHGWQFVRDRLVVLMRPEPGA
jgi:glycosyltransferase involved in cell wall biosynthesis